MQTLPLIILSLVIGAAGGLFFFGGLWVTIRYMPGKKNPILLAAVSFLLRAFVILLMFYFLAITTRIEAVLAALLGFLIARFALLKIKGRPLKKTAEKQAADQKQKKGGDV